MRGSSSAASAANAAISHVRDLVHGTANGWTSAAVLSPRRVRRAGGAVLPAPVTSDGTAFRVVEGLDLDACARARLGASVAELVAERDAVRVLGVI